MSDKIDVIIVDDEESARNILSNLIQRFHPQFNVVATCEDLPQAVAKIEKHQPQVVFLDIEMPNYAGYEITNFFDTINFEIIFVTAYDSYAIKAFEVAAFDYLLKPIEVSRLAITMERLAKKTLTKHDAINYQVLQESLNDSGGIHKMIVNYLGNQKIIDLKDIVALEASEAYTLIKDADNNTYTMSKNLKHFETLLENNSEFVRVHKSWIINTQHIEKYSHTEMLIYLKNDIVAKLSRYKKNDFEAAIES